MLHVEMQKQVSTQMQCPKEHAYAPRSAPTDALKRVRTLTRAKALGIWKLEAHLASRTARASCARFSGLYIPVGTRFSASVDGSPPS
ncbi:MAG TPA: hypothetical protein VHV10_15420 [Ktedonobacteraceae bacterium]|nr:hypothetical protein [Ktedonobacteraceae bacterium]